MPHLLFLLVECRGAMATANVVVVHARRLWSAADLLLSWLLLLMQRVIVVLSGHKVDQVSVQATSWSGSGALRPIVMRILWSKGRGGSATIAACMLRIPSKHL